MLSYPTTYELWDLEKIRVISSMDMKHVSIAVLKREFFEIPPLGLLANLIEKLWEALLGVRIEK